MNLRRYSVGGEPRTAAQLGTQVRRRTESAGSGDHIEAFLAAFQRPAGQGDPPLGQPGERSRGRLGAEATVQGGGADGGAGGEAVGASLLLLEPSGTSAVGDLHDDVPHHVDAITGHALEG